MNTIVEHYAKKARKVRGTDVKIGDKLYAIKHGKTGLFFIWTYVNREFAEKVSQRIAPNNPTDIAANWRKNVDELTPTNAK